MMKPVTSISLAFFLSVLASSVHSEPKGLTVIDKGLDRKSRGYSVICPDGRRLSLEHKYKDNEICMHLRNGKAPRCLSSNDIDMAARQACATQ